MVGNDDEHVGQLTIKLQKKNTHLEEKVKHFSCF